MSKTGFTPGPWKAINQGTDDEPMMVVMAERIRDRGFKHEVAICATGDSPQEMENANAHLISASPALHKALKRCIHEMHWSQSQESWNEALADAQTAIDEAEQGFD